MTAGDIKRLRTRLGLLSIDFAALLGVSQATVSLWECDKSPVSNVCQRALVGLRFARVSRIRNRKRWFRDLKFGASLTAYRYLACQS
jgi:DNA-binding transcriptional regulator YiaG